MQPEITRIDPHNINNTVKSIVKFGMVMTICINSTVKLTWQPDLLGTLLKVIAFNLDLLLKSNQENISQIGNPICLAF